MQLNHLVHLEPELYTCQTGLEGGQYATLIGSVCIGSER